MWYFNKDTLKFISQPAFTCSKSAIKIQEKGWKYVQS